MREGDTQWLDIVRWTHYAMLEAEERGVSTKNIDALKRELNDPYLRRLLGVNPGNGKALGLGEDWVYNIVKQVGNYGESLRAQYRPGLAAQVPARHQRLWSKGGLLLPLPLR